MKSIRSLLVAAVALGTGWAHAADAPEKVVPGTAQLQLRLRIENVEEASLDDEATATTLRTRLTWTSPLWRGWQAVIEADDIRALDESAYNSTVNGMTTRPVVADPVDTDLNRAVLEFRHPQFDVALGRQRIVLDNQRFIGNVAWRQNEQTYDAATLRWHAGKRVDVLVGWLANANRVFGPRSGSQPADFRGDSFLAQIAARPGRFGTVSAFWYGLAFDNAPAASNATLGLLWAGTADLAGGWKIPRALSFASQSDYGDNPTDYSAHYSQLELGIGRGPVTVRLGREVLTGDATRQERRFQTPLATLHAFQGYADKFLATPPQGIDDRYVALDASAWGITAQLRRHEFRAEAANRRYGTEWDASLVRKFGSRYELLGKFADYDAREFGVDTCKVWLMVTASF